MSQENAPASRTFEHCREWVKAGHRVTVITCVSVSRSFRRNLIGRGIDPAKIAVIMNGVDTSRFGPRPKEPELAA